MAVSATKSDTITVFPEVHAIFSPDKTAGCQPLPVSFINNTNIISGTNFFWDFDDGRFSNLATPPQHIFGNLTNVSQLHAIHLEATSQYGCYDDTTITVEAYPYIYAKFTIDRPAICADELFSIDRTSSAGAINHYYWDYENDGTVEEDKTNARFQSHLSQYRQFQPEQADQAHGDQHAGMRHLLDRGYCGSSSGSGCL